jgi:hypothetical protein
MRSLAPCLLISTSLYAQQAGQTVPTQAISTTDDIAALKKQMVEQQKQLEQLRAALQKQQELIDKATKQAEEAANRRVVPAASLGEVASTTPIFPMPAVVNPPMNPAQTANASQMGQGPRSESPLGFQIGGATFTPLGFVDFISVTHSTDAGSGIGTGFGGIPFSNSTAGGLSETHFSMQNSRVGLRVDSNYLGYQVLGYLETDFLGAAPTNPFVTSNSDTLRMRLFFVDLKKDAFEFTGGQTWSLMTPNRTAIGVLPSEIFYSQDIDTNYQLGLTWARQAGVRFTWNPNENFHWAVALENPEQYSGAAVTYPKNLATIATTELDNNAGGVAIPNLFPDVISKIALDGGSPGHKAHLEVTGLLTNVHTYNSLTTGPGADSHFTKVGGGAEINFSVEASKHFRFLSNNYYSDGGGRYVGTGLAPDAILEANGSPSLVHSASTVDGIEMQITPKALVYAYYGGVYVGKDTALDQDNKTLIGYGVANQTSANRAIQEATFGIQNNFWKSPQYGSLMLALQYSYLTRNPWNITTAGAPTSANMNIGFVDLRYTLP